MKGIERSEMLESTLVALFKWPVSDRIDHDVCRKHLEDASPSNWKGYGALSFSPIMGRGHSVRSDAIVHLFS